DHVDRLTGHACRQEARERRTIARERVPPPQRVDGHDERVRQADQQELPAERARRSGERCVLADPDHEHDEENETGDQRERPQQPSHVSRRSRATAMPPLELRTKSWPSHTSGMIATTQIAAPARQPSMAPAVETL